MSSFAPDNVALALEQAASDIETYIARIQRPLAQITSKFSSLCADTTATAEKQTPSLEQIANTLEQSCLDTLDQPSPRLIEGIGLAWVTEADTSGLVWWRSDNRVIARKHHVLNPNADSFYDYRNSLWYQSALDTQGITIVGPYFDAWGTDDHALTAAVRIMSRETVLGVAAADLNVQTFTVQVFKYLSSLPVTVLLGVEERIIASNHALLTPGLRLSPFLLKTGLKKQYSQPLSVHGWELVTLAETD